MKPRLALLLAAAALCACPDPAAPDRETCPGGAPTSADGACPSAPDAGSCPAGSLRVPGETSCLPAGPRVPGGFERDPSGWGLREIIAESCPPGTMPVLGERTCRPVGWTACPEGFEPEADGWGCRAVLPPEACAGASLAVIGEEDCVPLACPDWPEEADVWVNAAFADGELDSRHVRSLAQAVQLAPEGGLVAVEAGHYAGGFDITRPVRVVGRCADRVFVSAGGVLAQGIRVRGARPVQIAGLTFRQVQGGVSAVGGGLLVLSESAVERGTDKGLAASGSSAAGPSELRLRRVAVRDTASAPDGKSGWGVVALDGGRVQLEEVEVSRNHLAGLAVAGGTLEAASVVVSDTLRTAARTAVGIAVVEGQATVRRAAVTGSEDVGLLASEPGTLLVVEDSAIRGRLGSRPTRVGAMVLDGAVATLRRSALRDHPLGAAHAERGGARLALESVVATSGSSCFEGELCLVAWAHATGELEVRDSMLARSVYGGALASGEGTRASFHDSLLLDVGRPGLRGFGLGVEDGGALEAEGTAIVGAADYGLATSTGGRLSFRSGMLRRCGGDAGGAGAATFGGELSLERVAVLEPVGPGLAASGQGEATVLRASGVLVRAPRRSGPLVRAALVAARAEVLLTDCAFSESLDVGLAFVVGARGSVRRTSVTGTRASALDIGGGVVAAEGAALALEASALVDNDVAGLLAYQDVTVVQLRETYVGASRPLGAEFGDGVISQDARLDLTRCQVSSNRRIAALYSAGSGRISASLIDRNSVGLHAQQGSAFVIADEGREPGPGEVLVAPEVELTDNATRLGTGAVALPAMPFGGER